MYMNLEDCLKETLWPTLVETVHSLVMYPNHKAYTRLVILSEKPEITPADLAVRLKISLGEALVILYELAEERKAAS
jgi:transcription initiation factor IIE alpha subunit